MQEATHAQYALDARESRNNHTTGVLPLPCSASLLKGGHITYVRAFHVLALLFYVHMTQYTVLQVLCVRLAPSPAHGSLKSILPRFRLHCCLALGSALRGLGIFSWT